MAEGSSNATVTLIVILCLAISIPAVSLGHETPPPYPPLEPNDRFSQATHIEPRTLHGLEAIKFTNNTKQLRTVTIERPWFTQTAKIALPVPRIGSTKRDDSGTMDRDIYAVDVDAGDAVPVSLFHKRTDGNLRFTIYDPSKTKVETVDPDENWDHLRSGLGGGGVPIHRGNAYHIAQCSGTYYIEVTSDGQQGVPYRLEVDDRFEPNNERSDPTPVSPGTYDGLMITSYDKDIYRLNVSKGDEVTIDIDVTPQAHWETSVEPSDVDVDIDGDSTPTPTPTYDHADWENPSFKFRVSSARDTEIDILAINVDKYDEMHQDRMRFTAESSGHVYIYARGSFLWQERIRGVPKWQANSAQYSMDIRVDDATTPADTGAESTGDETSIGDVVDDDTGRIDVGTSLPEFAFNIPTWVFPQSVDVGASC